MRKNNLQLISLFKDREEQLLLVGSGREKERYLNYIKLNNINNVHIMDYMNRRDIFEVLKACDCHISLSLEDIYGHTIIEAMANGIPVISSKNVVAARDIIENNKNGFLVDIKDEASIIKAIEEVDSSMSEYAINTAKKYTMESSAKRLCELLEINK